MSGSFPAPWNLQTLCRVHKQTEITKKTSPPELLGDPLEEIVVYFDVMPGGRANKDKAVRSRVGGNVTFW